MTNELLLNGGQLEAVVLLVLAKPAPAAAVVGKAETEKARPPRASAIFLTPEFLISTIYCVMVMPSCLRCKRRKILRERV